jgi:hypothetical protein
MRRARAPMGGDPAPYRVRHGGRLKRAPGAVSGRSTLLSGLFRRRTPVSEDLRLLLALAAGATLEPVVPASTGPGTEFDEGGRCYGWEG